jgi:hypothetical protein
MFKSEVMLHLGVVAETEPVDGSKHSNIVQVRMAAIEPQMAQYTFCQVLENIHRSAVSSDILHMLVDRKSSSGVAAPI